MSASWLRWSLAAAMLGVALFHVSRLVAARARHRPASELTHVAMGVVMTVMLVGVLTPSDSRRLAVLFAAPLGWFVWQGVHSFVMDGTRAVGRPVRDAVGCAAMVYMLVAVSGASMSSMPGMSTGSASSPLFAITLVLATLGVGLWALVRPHAVGAPTTPALAAGCQLAMTGTTVYMLMVM